MSSLSTMQLRWGSRRFCSKWNSTMVTNKYQKREKVSAGSRHHHPPPAARLSRISAQRRLSSDTRLLMGAECTTKAYASAGTVARGMCSEPGDDGTTPNTSRQTQRRYVAGVPRGVVTTISRASSSTRMPSPSISGACATCFRYACGTIDRRLMSSTRPDSPTCVPFLNRYLIASTIASVFTPRFYTSRLTRTPTPVSRSIRFESMLVVISSSHTLHTPSLLPRCSSLSNCW